MWGDSSEDQSGGPIKRTADPRVVVQTEAREESSRVESSREGGWRLDRAEGG